MDKKIAMYTVIFGGYDSLKEDESIIPPAGVDFFIVTDTKDLKTRFYNVIHKEDVFANPQKAARYYKINSHLLFPDYDWVFFHDGLIEIKLNKIHDLLKTVDGYDFLSYHHHIRNCTYREAKVIKAYALEYSKIVDRQVRQLKKCKFPKNAGLFESFFLFRNHKNLEIIKMNEHWWSEVNEFSLRDQLSLTFVAHQYKINKGYFQGKGRNSQFFDFHSHKKNRSPKYDSLYQFLYYKVSLFYYFNFRSTFLKVKEKLLLLFFGKKPFNPK
ncbi:MAG: glycosyltransferase domain-containing protein [Candidatus Woesearchaeota archaeon]